MSGSFPGGRVHEDSSIYPYNVLMELYHRFPPIFTEVFLEFYPILCVVIYSTEPIIDFTGGEYIAVFLGMGNYFLENVFLICHSSDFKQVQK